ncbi:MAG: phenylalanine--tRNA ligase subunit beta [Bacillota bacterium]|nr:phenylalanine--tRNA ligase subunit beta [Bacillota bacterium]
MKLPLSWLYEYTKITASPEEYNRALTMTGSKVEAIEYLGEEIDLVVVGKIESIERHPDSDHLWICGVNVGDKTLQIVTGAQNLKGGELVPVALDGSALPGGKKIKSGKLRGVLSDGMLCSFQELGLTQNDAPFAYADGIFVLSEGNCKPGDDIRKVLGFDEYVCEFEITSNRPDCLSVIGLARESAATFSAGFSVKTPIVSDAGGDIKDYLSVSVDSKNLCARYSARVVKNVKIAPSPKWMRDRLRACGIRPINNIVDITNYVMLEYGQPMHAFDYSCLEGSHITVRNAKDGEVFNTLDGQNRKLSSDMLVIADSKKPVAVAGVMGGENSEIKDDTQTVVFESANFDGASVRVTAKKLGMRTESSARFEKGLDPSNTMPALDRACELVALLSAGEVVGGFIDDAANFDPSPRRIRFETDRINKLLGVSLTRDEMISLLSPLGFAFDEDEVIIPSWRLDIELMADLAEEVARMYGYDKIPTTMLSGVATEGRLTKEQKFESTVSEACRSAGFYEIMSYSFIGPKQYDKVRMPENSPLRISTTILNPLSEDMSVMRTTSLPSMLEAIARNYNYRNEKVRLFETATVYLPEISDGKADPAKLPNECKVLTLACFGEMGYYDMKGALEAVFEYCSVFGLSYSEEPGNPSYHPGRCANVYSNGAYLGTFGQIHPLVLKNFGIDEPVFAAEISFDALLEAVSSERVYKPLPKFPAVTRDLALVCDKNVPAQRLTDCIKESIGKRLETISIFDVYEGSQIGAGKKSIAFSLTLRESDRTLTDQETDDAIKKVLISLKDQLKVEIRR